jgi:hypothetical protein
MKKFKMIFALMVTLVVIFGFSVASHATLYDRGTDARGNKLIYDSDLDITWYDYTEVVSDSSVVKQVYAPDLSLSYNNWGGSVDWAGDLTVGFGGTVYDDWRLPSTIDGLVVHGNDGTTTAGYNIVSSELGHLFYEELWNKGYYDASGTYVGDGNYGMNNMGIFKNLLSSWNVETTLYLSGTYVGGVKPDKSTHLDEWFFDFADGKQDVRQELDWDFYQGLYVVRNNFYGLIAVRDGDVSALVTPEPSTYLLLGSGIAGLIVWRRKRKV